MSARCFDIFKLIHKLVDDTSTVKMVKYFDLSILYPCYFVFQVATDVVKEFADDGVRYLEIRTTPRSNTNTGKHTSSTGTTLHSNLQHRDEQSCIH